MHEDSKTDRALTDHANEQEKQWDWLGAADTYEKVLRKVPDDDHLRIGDLLERRAYALHKAALQADSIDQFEKQNQEAINICARARQTYEDATETTTTGRKHRCDAMTSYLGFWLAGNYAEKRKFVDKAWKDTKSSLSVFEAQGMCREFALTFNRLSYAAAFSYDYDGEAESRENTLKEALSCAEKSIRYLSELKDNEDLARAHARAAALLVAIEVDFASYSDKDKVDLEALNHWVKARELAEEVAMSETPFMVILAFWPAALTIEDRYACYMKGKEIAEKARDHFMIGCALDGLAQRKFLLARTAEDSVQMEALSEEGFEISKTARENLTKVRFFSPSFVNVWVHVPEAGYYYYLSSETHDPELKRNLIYKAQHPCMEQLRVAEESGYPDIRCAAYFLLGSVLKDLGKNESGIDMKRSYLEQAVEKLTVAIDQDRRIHPTEYLAQGMDLLSLAEAKFEIAHITADMKKKTSILREAVNWKQEALGLCEKELNATQDSNPEISSEIAEGYRETGNWAKELCATSGDSSCLGLVAECLDKAVFWYSKAGLSNQSAETNWEAAQAYDKLGEFFKAAERFDSAAEDYRKAADNVPRLEEFYADYAIYMRAWGEIERGRYHHMRQEPGLAKDCYENASAMHKSSRRWSYLTMNYSAWAKVEHAEDLSRNENHQEAVKAFEEAAHLFKESKKNLHDQLAKIEDSSELQSARDLQRAADARSDYCKARIILEKAGALDKKGDVSASAEKYGQAADLFDKILTGLESDRDRKEIQLVATLSKAWQAMAKAEAETSPDHYDKASQLFEEAKDLSTGEKAKLLMAGHSRFCRALGIGARFVDTGDITLHAEATKYLESAADFYLKADHHMESVYAKASKLLFDAYVHIGKASREEDQVKKAKLYTMAEKVLQTSASAYDKAKEPNKRDQVLRLLEKVRDDRELALMLTEILHAPDAASQTDAFPVPTPSRESATGLDRFEQADVQVVLIARPKHLRLGQDLEVVVEMTNAGKRAAQLIKLKDPVPEGFTLKENPEGYQMEDGSLNLGGKRLNPLMTEEINLVLKPGKRGQFALKPQILYLDEGGKYKSHEPEPMKVTVGQEETALTDKNVLTETPEAAEARQLLDGLNVITLSHYRIVGNYVRYGVAVRNALKDARQKIVAACRSTAQKRENFIIWAPPGSGKTYFVQEVAALLGESARYRELNLAKLDEEGFRSGLAGLRDSKGPCLCLIDEVDAKPDEGWPYEALLPFLDARATEGALLVFVLAGSSGSSAEDMKKKIASRPKGSDMLSRVPTENEYSIPSMGVGDRLLVVLSQFRQAGKQMGHEVREVEKLGLYYVAVSPRLSNARQLHEFAVRCAERVLPGDDRLKYDSLFSPGDLENKLFWTQALQSAGALVDTFLLIED
jgi:hypothetical protein